MTQTEEEQQLEKQLRQELAAFIDDKSITKLPDGGFLIKPKRDITQIGAILMGQKMTKLGGMLKSNGCFELKCVKTGNKDSIRHQRIALTDLVPGYSPRLYYDDGSIEPLYADMRVNGQTQDIVVRPSLKFEGKYELIDGNRRRRSAELLQQDKTSKYDWTALNAEVRDLSDSEAYLLALTFFNRKELSPFELGRYFKEGMQQFRSYTRIKKQLRRHLVIRAKAVSRS